MIDTEWKCARTAVPPINTRFLGRGKGYELTLIMRSDSRVYEAHTGLPMIFKIEEWRRI